jgi:hypothetical protein
MNSSTGVSPNTPLLPHPPGAAVHHHHVEVAARPTATSNQAAPDHHAERGVLADHVRHDLADHVLEPLHGSPDRG